MFNGRKVIKSASFSSIIMKLTLRNKILIIFVAFIIIFQFVTKYNAGCHPNSACWGPKQIKILGLPYSSAILVNLLLPFVVSFLITVATSMFYYFMKKSTSEKTINFFVGVFSMIFLLIFVLYYFFIGRAVY